MENDSDQDSQRNPAVPANDGTTLSQDDGKNDSGQEEKGGNANEQIQIYVREISEMVAFLDYSFERAFTIKEKSYIRAYKDHVLDIQKSLNKIMLEVVLCLV